jgi:hypothetical protein
LKKLLLDNSRFRQAFEPKDGLVGFFYYDPHLRREFCPRSCPACCSVIRSDRGARSKQLLSQNVCVSRVREVLKESNDSKRKLLRSISKFLLFAFHRSPRHQEFSDHR